MVLKEGLDPGIAGHRLPDDRKQNLFRWSNTMASGLFFFFRFDGCRRQKIGKQTERRGIFAGLRILFLGTRSMDINFERKEILEISWIQEKTRLGQNSEARGLKLFGIFKTEKERCKDKFLAV